MIGKACAAVIVLALGLSSASAQLAITEAMSSAATNQGANLVSQNSDWWELTNFGTNALDLTGYKWNDNAGGLIGGDPAPFEGLMIAPGESIIFFQTNSPASTNAEQFRQWWNLSPTVQAVIYVGNGLSSTGDGIRLWGPTAVTDGDVADSVDFVEALRGSTFTYDPETGIFGVFGTNGVGGAFRAATADDVGSPGTTTGPVPLVIAQQPTNTSVNPGDTAMFSVTVRGLPRPVVQWSFNGVPIEGARSRTLFVTNVQSDKLGEYSVIVDNGFQSLVSSNAALSLNVAPEPPQFTLAPKNNSVFIGQGFTLTAQASGVPEPAYQWRKEGVDIPGATSSSYTVSSADLPDAGVYSVAAMNSVGALTNEATVAVTRRPRLVVTEIMPAQSTNGPFRGHNDWWELTNFDDFTVDLTAYRFDDGSAVLAAAITFTNTALSIAPGESVVFVEAMSAEAFRQWWGAANLASNQQIVSYAGAGLSLSSLGDVVALWNSGAVEDSDTIATEVFSTATEGVSFGYDPMASIFGDLSQEGVHGAFRARENGDVGSPGYIRNRPEPRITRIARAGQGYSVTWLAEAGVSYTLQYKNSLDETTWTPLNTVAASGVFLTATDPVGANVQRFYRVAREP